MSKSVALNCQELLMNSFCLQFRAVKCLHQLIGKLVPWQALCVVKFHAVILCNQILEPNKGTTQGIPYLQNL